MFVKLDQLLHKFLRAMPVFGQICVKTVNFTPDLSTIAPKRIYEISLKKQNFMPLPWIVSRTHSLESHRIL
jgi:hypothetical protein